MADNTRPLAGRSILLLLRYTDIGPSSRLRMGQYVPLLEAAGAKVTVSSLFDDDYLAGYFGQGIRSPTAVARAQWLRARALAGAQADLAWVERELFPFLPGVFERTLRLRQIPYVVDMDDAVFHRYDEHRSRAVRAILGRKLDPLLAGSSAVTVGNAYLADYTAKHGARRIVRVPTVVDPARYPVRPPPAGDRLRVGWIGTPANASYLAVLAEACRLLGTRLPITLVTVGAPQLADFPVPQELHPWSLETEADVLSTIDVGVMPLTDNAFERGKCGYKLIQYMAAGRAVVASPVGVNREIVDPSVGLLASTAQEWCDALLTLGRDQPLRRGMGEAGRAKVERQYSVDVTATQIINLFASIVKEHAR